MRKIAIMAAMAATLLSVSCQKTPVAKDGLGTLSLGELVLSMDDAVITKAVSAASGTYAIKVYDASGAVVVNTNYAAVKNADNKIQLPAGDYTLWASSSDEDIQPAAFEQPVYGATKEFTIVAGETTSITDPIVCTLQQVKVSVSYSDEFLSAVTGPGSTSVSVTSGYQLEYQLSADGSYERSAGYFAVTGSTMEVVFSGSVNGKQGVMRKTVTGIAAKQWRQVKFVQKKNDEGNATFEIVIEDLVSDETINNEVAGSEDVIGDDPDAPKGDGGIEMNFDYEAGCDAQLTDMSNILIVPVSERAMAIKLRATVPGGVKKFTVSIASSSPAFTLAVEAASATLLDLINPLPENDIIFQVVPFPHGQDLVGQTDIAFDLSAAQAAIINYPGVHTFTMKVTDQNNCSKAIPITMVVE